MSSQPSQETNGWQIEDVRGIWSVATVGGQPAVCLCGFCGSQFRSAGWIRLSVARHGIGGTVIDLCDGCSALSWEAIAAHLAAVQEQLRLADALRARLGP